MSPALMVLSRLFLLTFGRLALISIGARKILVAFMVKRAQSKYVAASKYFDLKKLASSGYVAGRN